MRILIAPSGFKESLSAELAAACIETGVRTALPTAQVTKVPVVDGGEGFTQCLVGMTGGRIHRIQVTGPVGAPVDSHFGFLGGAERKTAVIEMAAAAGLRLVPPDRRDPRFTTSYGVGELIRHAIDAGAERIVLGHAGAELARLCRIDLSGRDPRLDRVRIEAAVNWHNVLLGPRGVARVFGPQKGATPEMVAELERALETYAAAIRRDLDLEVGREPGSGASGGLGTGLAVFLGASLEPRHDVILRHFDLEAQVAAADLVLTAEGRLDGQTPYGKVPAEVAALAKRAGIPVIVLAGSIGKGAYANLQHGIDAYMSIIKHPCSLDEAIDEGEKLLSHAAEHAVRMVHIGYLLRSGGVPLARAS